MCSNGSKELYFDGIHVSPEEYNSVLEEVNKETYTFEDLTDEEKERYIKIKKLLNKESRWDLEYLDGAFKT